MQLSIKKQINKEIVHYSDGEKTVTSRYRTVYIEDGKETKKIKLPDKLSGKVFGLFRLSRRALRLDKCNVYPIDNNYVIIRDGTVYFYDGTTDTLSVTQKLQNCRVILHQSIGQTPDGQLYFGEYGANKARTTVPVYRSKDRGRSWEIVHTFQPKEIKHVHGCFYDKYTDKIWVTTGDFEDESWLLVANRDFSEVKKIGDGQQRYRTCHLIFRETEVHWIMDSQLEASYHIVLNRMTETIETKTKFLGPVWYIKEVSDDAILAATVQEIGDGVLDNKIHLSVSTDLESWQELRQFEHDGLPKRYFKWGVVGFADGIQSSDSFYMFFEAVKGYDGKAVLCELK